ncbi:MAG: SPOR domain-containing protein, partial [Gammaproteobacteria bacterium]|nr:SPOR domain-containing protein [Gammaproteobacteria bacterium]
PKFDFYTILPNEKIKVMPVPKSGVQYVLQIAVVKKFAEADRLKAELALLGFDAFVTKVKSRGGEINRVLVGPYFSKKAAVIDQRRLMQNQIKSILHKEKS